MAKLTAAQRKTKLRAARDPYWTKKRVIDGLQRAAKVIWNNEVDALPTSSTVYEQTIYQHEPLQKGQHSRIFPRQLKILQFFSSMNQAWLAAGFMVQTIGRSKWRDKLTPAIDERLREIYSHGKVGGHMPAGVLNVTQFAKSIGIPKFVLIKRAHTLGIGTVKEPNWSAQEIKFLESVAHLSPEIIYRRFAEKGYHRTLLSIVLMRKRRGAHKGSPYYSVAALAQLIGVDAHQFDRVWFLKYPGELKYEVKGVRSTKRNGPTKLIHVDTIREFIFNHPEEIDLKKVDPMWFLWLVTKGRVKMTEPSRRLSKRHEGYQPHLVTEHRKKAA